MALQESGFYLLLDKRPTRRSGPHGDPGREPSDQCAIVVQGLGSAVPNYIQIDRCPNNSPALEIAAIAVAIDLVKDGTVRSSDHALAYGNDCCCRI
jgi:hypothetical protein